MIEEATKLGANAVISFRFQSAAIMQGAVEMVTYGIKIYLVILQKRFIAKLFDIILIIIIFIFIINNNSKFIFGLFLYFYLFITQIILSGQSIIILI